MKPGCKQTKAAALAAVKAACTSSITVWKEVQQLQEIIKGDPEAVAGGKDGRNRKGSGKGSRMGTANRSGRGLFGEGGSSKWAAGTGELWGFRAGGQPKEDEGCRTMGCVHAGMWSYQLDRRSTGRWMRERRRTPDVNKKQQKEREREKEDKDRERERESERER